MSMIYNFIKNENEDRVTDRGPEIRNLARMGLAKYTRHAIERIKEYGLTVMQVNEMLKNCNHNQSLGDCNGYRVEGRAPALDTTGTIHISAHVHLSETILVITVINN
jgi:hypothetical protein